MALPRHQRLVEAHARVGVCMGHKLLPAVLVS